MHQLKPFISDPQVTEKSRQYLRLRTDVLHFINFVYVVVSRLQDTTLAQ